MNYEAIYNVNKQDLLFGRYITLQNIEPILKSISTHNELSIVGYSVQEKPIYKFLIGSGKIKILIWSQMHGNESTTTKSIFDFLNLLKSESDLAKTILQNFTFCIIPMLNPDGAALYTRENANNIDLNRDFKDLSQPESNVLMQVFNDFKPHFCYNMHDQRTIHGIAQSGKPATVSFLAPSFNYNCDYNFTRSKASLVIATMFSGLSKLIPDQIGRFDDAYNENCAGDNFQKLGIPTILFEAGHFQDDYQREITRKYIFISLLISFESIIEDKFKNCKIEDYLAIPQNSINFYDIVCRNVNIIGDNHEKKVNFALQYNEVLVNNAISFILTFAKINDLENDFGHLEINANSKIIKRLTTSSLQLENIADLEIGDDFNIINGKLIS